MILKKIVKEDLIFSNDLGDTCTNTYLILDDYDWMNYTLTTWFKTEEMGTLTVEFNYFGSTVCLMKVEQILNGCKNRIEYEYSADIFKKHIVKFLEKHISSWYDKYAFDGEDEAIEFFNDVLENGNMRE